MVHKIYRKMKEQSVKSSPFRLRCERPLIQLIGSNGSLATTLPSNLKQKKKFLYFQVYFRKLKVKIYMVENMLSRNMKAKLIAIIDFILTSDNSRLFVLSFSSWRSSFFFEFLSVMSGNDSFCFSTTNIYPFI